MVPPFFDSIMDRVNVTVDPDGMVPTFPGSPDAAGKELIRYSPVGTPTSDCEFTLHTVPLGLLVLSNHWPLTFVGLSR